MIPSEALNQEVKDSIGMYKESTATPADPIAHPAVTSTASYVRSLQGMIGHAHPSVLYAQAVLRPSLALAQGHSLALIQGIETSVYEWNIDPDTPNFDDHIRKTIRDLRADCVKKGLVCSVEIGDGIKRNKHTLETLRICVRDGAMVHAVVLYASKTMLLHRIQDLADAEGTISGAIFERFDNFCLANEPIEKGHINHVAIVDGKLPTSRNEINDNGHIVDACYPNIPEGATKLVDRYLINRSSVLNLFGVGGTGKSTLMRKVAARSNGRHTLLVDTPTIYKDPVLSGNLMAMVRALCAEGKKVLLLLEEVDNFIREKTIDNDFLVQLLSMSSGVIELDVKVVLASNLKNSDAVLNVLSRAGRTFATVEFEAMAAEQAMAARDGLGLPKRELEKSHYTLAEAICEDVTRIGQDKNRTGFTG